MKKTAYILRDGSRLPQAVLCGLLAEEFACYQATLAGLQVCAEADGPPQDAEGVIFLFADCLVEPEALRKALCGMTAKNAVLSAPDGERLGLVLDAEHAEDPMRYIDLLPRVLVRSSCRITAENYQEIFAQRQARLRQKYREDGVFLESDEVTLSPLYTIGRGTFLGRGTVLEGRGRIGQECALIGGTRLHNCVLGDGVRVERSVLLDTEVGNDTTVGPFAYLRPGTRIGAHARIGDFVEIKNSAIGDKTKVSHLTYIGDSDVGRSVNFGCGTVTSNYDGIKKHRTVIEDHVFIGCNTNLIAPVTVGKNSYIAAGSTVTQAVPEGALAIARARQTNKENWVQQNKPELIK